MLPSQTAGKKLPYMYTQCEDIACRSLVPMQDTPAIKITYTAKVRVVNDLTAMMSANHTQTVAVNDTHNEYQFKN